MLCFVGSLFRKLSEQAEQLYSFSTLLFVAKTIFVPIVGEAVLQQAVQLGISFRHFRIRARPSDSPTFNLFSRCQRFVADTGATHHLSYRFLSGDSLARWERAQGVGSSLWVQLSRLGHCILPSPKKGSTEQLSDELCSIPVVVLGSGGSFFWTPDKCWIEHPTLQDPIQLSVTDMTPHMTCDQFDFLRSLPLKQPLALRRFEPLPDVPTLSIVLLHELDSVFDAAAAWWATSYLIQWSPKVLRLAWKKSDRDPASFLRLLRELSVTLESDLCGGDSFSVLDETCCPQVRFQDPPTLNRLTRQPNSFWHSEKRVSRDANLSGELQHDDPAFQLVENADDELSNDLRATNDLANLRRKGPISYDDQARVTALVAQHEHAVCHGDVAYPQHLSFGHSGLWVIEVLKVDRTDVGQTSRIHRLVLPFAVRSESFEDLKPILLLLRYKILQTPYEWKTEAERATKHSAFSGWCGSHGISISKSHDFRHPSFEVAVGQVERLLRKLHHSQFVPGSVLWASSCCYLLFRALSESEEIFKISVAFKHAFKRDHVGRMAFSPPTKKNDVVLPNGTPCILLYPKWNSHHTCIGLVPSSCNRGLKLAELFFPELKISRSLAFNREISSTLQVRHFIKQPFKRVTEKKIKPPFSVSCPACVRLSTEGGRGGRSAGRPPSRHLCGDTCLFAERHIFTDPELKLALPQADAEGQVVADIAIAASQLKISQPSVATSDISFSYVQLRRMTAGNSYQDGISMSPEIPHSAYLQLVSSRNQVESLFSTSPDLRRFCHTCDMTAQVAATALRDAQTELRNSISRELYIANHENEFLATDTTNHGTSTEKIRIHRVSTIGAAESTGPQFYAVTLNLKEEAKRAALPTDEGRALLEEIHQSGNREIANLLERGVVKLVPVSDVSNQDIILPSLVIMTRKRDGRLKSRLVACGNFDTGNLDCTATYSSTVDGSFWRLLLVLSVLMQFSVVGIDVSEAFTQANAKDDKCKKTFLRMPSQWRNVSLPPHLQEQGVSLESFNRWCLQVLGWIYGERAAPKAWRATLVKWLLALSIEGMYLQVSQYDADILFLASAECCLIICLFVDDIWIFAQKPQTAVFVLQELARRFRCTEPEWLCGNPDEAGWVCATSPADSPTFCAINMYFVLLEGTIYLVLSQVEFLDGAFRKLLEKKVCTEDDLKIPLHELNSKYFLQDYLQEDCSDNPLMSPDELSKLRALVNTISYAALRTRSDVAAGLGCLARGQTVAGRRRFYEQGIQLLRYVHTTRGMVQFIDTGIRTSGKLRDYVAQPLRTTLNLPIQITSQFDASLGCSESTLQGGCSQDGYARQGCHVFVSLPSLKRPVCEEGVGALVTSRTGLQATISTSTTESELTSCTSASKEAVSHCNIIREVFAYASLPAAVLYGDNSAANSIGGCVANLRKVRHLSLAQLWCRAATLAGQTRIEFVPTARNTADYLTKVLHKQRLGELRALIGMRDVSQLNLL